MKIFEFHFNSTQERENVSQIFTHQPVNVYEKRGGFLFLAGEIEKSIPENKKFLEKICQNIKKSYYEKIKKPEKSFADTLKKTNQFLREEIKKENIHWLGNLNFAIAAIKKSELFYTQTGNVKTLLIRGGEITDISQHFDKQEIEPYPLKVFLSVVSGKVAQDDLIVIVNKETYSFFKEEGILDRLKKTLEIDEDKLKKIIPPSLKDKKMSGFCLLIALKNEENNKKVINKKTAKKIQWGRLIEKGSLKKKLKGKKVILIILLLFLIFTGLFLQQREKRKEEERIIYFQEQIKEAKSAEREKANLLLQDILKETDNKLIIEETKSLLNEINSLSVIKDPELLIEFSDDLLDLVYLNNELFFLSKDKICSMEKECLSLNFKTVTPHPLGVVSFSTPEEMTVIQNKEKKSFSISSIDFNYDEIYSYLQNLYFLDRDNCHILLYSYLGGLEWQEPEYWIEQGHPCHDLAIDGSIWVLRDSSIDLLYRQEHLESFDLEFYPEIKRPTQIKTRRELDYLYLLDPENKRIIITDKKAKMVKQFQSDKFDHLVSFEISEDGEKIWLVNKNKVYQIDLF